MTYVSVTIEIETDDGKTFTQYERVHVPGGNPRFYGQQVRATVTEQADLLATMLEKRFGEVPR